MSDNITLPRELVEKAIKAFENGCPPTCENGMIDSGGFHPWGEPMLDLCPACLAFEHLRTHLAAEPTKPSGYAYRYADGVLRLNDGSQFNGGWPVEAVPYWFAPPALAAPEPERHPGYVIGSHWLETAYSRICAGEAEADVLRDIGLVREEAFLTGVAHLKAENEALRRDAESWRKSKEKYTAWQKGTDLLETIHLQHAEIERLRDEVRVLRLYGNKDCTAMADEAMKKAALRQEDKT